MSSLVCTIHRVGEAVYEQICLQQSALRRLVQTQRNITTAIRSVIFSLRDSTNSGKGEGKNKKEKGKRYCLKPINF